MRPKVGYLIGHILLDANNDPAMEGTADWVLRLWAGE